MAETDFPLVAIAREAFELLDRAKVVGTTRDQALVIRQLSGLLSDLGFDPVARSQLGVAEVRTLSKLEEFGKGRAFRFPRKKYPGSES